MSYRQEKTEQGLQIVIDGFEKGIGQSPYAGLGDMRNVDPTTIPGEASVAMAPAAMITQVPVTALAFTVDPNTEIFTTLTAHGLEVNTVITVANSGGALPTGMSANTPYYIKTVPSSTTFTVSAVSAGGATLNVTGAGSGTNSLTTINMGTPTFIRQTRIVEQEGFGGFSNINYYFLLDSNGRCWVLDNSNLGNTQKWVYMQNLASESSTNDGNGLIAWKNWVFVFTGTSIRVMPLIYDTFSNLAYLTTKANWTAWQSIENLGVSSTSHYAMIGQDDVVYFCNGRFVGSIAEPVDTIFAPSTGRVVADGVTTNNDETITSATIVFTKLDVGSLITGTGIPSGTFIRSINSSTSAEMSQQATASNTGVTFTIPQSNTFNDAALDIPTSDETVSLAELGVNLLIGGRNNYIYPWDRVSPSYSFPIFLSENYVSRMVTVNTTTFIFCGRRGRIYVLNGSNVNLYWKMPDFLSGTVNPTFIWTDAIFARNLLFFGIRCKTAGGTVVNEFGGLWALTPENACGWLINQMTYGTYSGYVSALGQNIGNSTSISSTTGVFGQDNGYGLFMGWNDGTNGGIDKGTALPYVASQAIITSDMIPVGTFLDKKTFENVEYKLASPLVAGETMVIKYRKNIAAAFVEVPITQGGTTGELSGIGSVNFEDAEWVQLQAVLSSTVTTPSFNRLREFRLK